MGTLCSTPSSARMAAWTASSWFTASIRCWMRTQWKRSLNGNSTPRKNTASRSISKPSCTFHFVRAGLRFEALSSAGFSLRVFSNLKQRRRWELVAVRSSSHSQIETCLDEFHFASRRPDSFAGFLRKTKNRHAEAYPTGTQLEMLAQCAEARQDEEAAGPAAHFFMFERPSSAMRNEHRIQ